jgi:hypothetical protein
LGIQFEGDADAAAIYVNCVIKIASLSSAGPELPSGQDVFTALDRNTKAPIHIIVKAHDGLSDTTVPSDESKMSNKVGTGSSIYWDPHGNYLLERRFEKDSAGAERYIEVRADPCAELFHEMVHAKDVLEGVVDTSLCGKTLVLHTEDVKANLAENDYRKHFGLPLRKEPEVGQKLPPDLKSCAGGKKGKISGPLRACGSTPCASSNGDPHLTTFDGLHYDFQAAGEFIASKSIPGSFEIQVRQEPWFGSTDVSVNSAVAFKVIRDHFGVYVGSTGFTTRLNGSLRVLREGTTRLPSGGSISRTQTDSGPVYSVIWPDSSQAWVSPVGSWGLVLDVAPARGLRGHLTGLLGNLHGEASNELVTRAAQTIKNPPSFHDLYQVFGDSWRIRQSESLFDYAPGESTATFTNRRLPTRPISAADLPNGQAAEAICHSMGVTDPKILQACALDVATTGQAAFSDSAAATQAALTAESSSARASSIGQANALAAMLSPTASPRVFSVDRAGQNVRAGFAGTAGQALDLGFTGVTVGGESRYYWVTVLAPDGSKLVDTLLSGSDNLHLDPLAATGSYTVIVNPDKATTGTITLTLSKRRP